MRREGVRVPPLDPPLVEHTSTMLHTKALLVLEIFRKVFTLYGNGSYFCPRQNSNLTSSHLMDLSLIGLVATEKQVYKY